MEDYLILYKQSLKVRNYVRDYIIYNVFSKGSCSFNGEPIGKVTAQ